MCVQDLILLNKMCKYHTLLFATELIFCNNPKSNGKIQGDATFWVGLQNTSSLQHSIMKLPLKKLSSHMTKHYAIIRSKFQFVPHLGL